MKGRTNVSMDPDLMIKAKKRAKEKGFSFSGYVVHLINNDLDGKQEISAGHIDSTPIIKKSNSEVINAIEDILS